MSASGLVRLSLIHLLGVAVLTAGARTTVWMSGVAKNTAPELGGYWGPFVVTSAVYVLTSGLAPRKVEPPLVSDLSVVFSALAVGVVYFLVRANLWV
jgi:hypothetical protein